MDTMNIDERLAAAVRLLGSAAAVDELLAGEELHARGLELMQIKSARQRLIRLKSARPRPLTCGDLLGNLSRTLVKGFDPRCQ